MQMKNRPDPNELLKQIDNEKKGSLKIFLGAAAGVGKTYAMLKAVSKLTSEAVSYTHLTLPTKRIV